jgi:hypothetical protein
MAQLPEAIGGSSFVFVVSTPADNQFLEAFRTVYRERYGITFPNAEPLTREKLREYADERNFNDEMKSRIHSMNNVAPFGIIICVVRGNGKMA